ncbi:cycloheximide resistance protein [Eremomyces bilateralis CBS 781.70]|uniref:Cycloheximide resistance protein n=1 Tax=Eremomyces bilateralis CBS 781.70 TaxID=1392243 RepID=A0A6G1FYA8_9PEZI|nr:cycloheximide resistance protein [Eremomyces bilateralis CBS 781.70]KAF1810827.1 cycloheximide resistance protein [Eremomyces bilateralis CBS 781.70]
MDTTITSLPKSVEDQGAILTKLRSRDSTAPPIDPEKPSTQESNTSTLDKFDGIQGKDLEAGYGEFCPQKEAKPTETRIERLSISPSDDDTPDNPNLVAWDGVDDPQNPMNWPNSRRWSHIGIVSALTFFVGLCSSMFAPGVPQLMRQFDSTNEALGSFVVTVFVLGLAAGPVVFAPLSELKGRYIVQHIGTVGFTAFTIACALAPNMEGLIVIRLFQGIFGSVGITNGGAIISDIVKQEERGVALSMYSYGVLFGPIIGPIAGGFLNTAKGWRWVFWVLSICLGVITCLSFLIWRESYEPFLLRKKAARLRQETGNLALRSEYDSDLPPRVHFARGIARAICMLIFSPVVLSLSIYTGLVYAYFYLLFTTFTSIFSGIYNFSTDIVGLSFVGVGVGFLIGQIAFSNISDRLLKSLAAKRGGGFKPEYRMPPCLIGAVCIPIGLFWYGWAAQARAHWIVPLIGTSFVGLGNSIIFMSITTYTIDAYGMYSASALAANTVTRSIMAAVLPLAAPPMYAALGIGWGNSLLAFLAIAMMPVPWLLFKYGERLRRVNVEKFTYI